MGVLVSRLFTYTILILFVNMLRNVGEYPKLEIVHRRRSLFFQTLHESLINFIMAHYITTVQSISNNIPISLEMGTVAELFGQPLEYGI